MARALIKLPDAAAPAGAGLTRVDHLAQTMNYEEMLTWLAPTAIKPSTRRSGSNRPPMLIVGPKVSAMIAVY